MSLNGGLGLGFLFTATDAASGVMRGLGTSYMRLEATSERSAKNTQAAMGAVMTGFGSLRVGAAAMRTAFDSAMDAGTFEQNLQRARLIMGSSVEEMGQMREKAMQSGMSSKFAPQEALEGIKELGTLGFTASESMAALDGTLNFAAASGLSVADASMTTGAALRIFSKDANEAAETADKLLKISDLTALASEDLQLALGSVSRGASATKQPLDDMLIAIGLVKNTGVDASVAGQSVSSATLAIAKNASVFRDLGIEVTKADGSFKSFLDIALDTGKVMEGMKDEPEKVAMLYDLFTKFGLTATAAIGTQLAAGIKTATGETVKQEQALEYLRGTMKAAGGEAQKYKDATLDTLPGQLSLVKSMGQTLMLEVGDAVAKVLKPMVEHLRDGVDFVVKGYKQLSPPMQKGLALMTLIGGAILAGGGAFVAFAGSLSLALPLITAMATGFVSAAGAIVPTIGAIMALGGAFMYLKGMYDRNIGGLADTLRPLFDKVRLFFGGMYQLITDGFISGPMAKQIQDPQHSGLLQFMIVLVKWGYRAKVWVETFIDTVQGLVTRLTPHFEEAGKTIDKIRNIIADIVGDVDGMSPTMDKVTSSAETVATAITTIFGLVATAFSTTMSMTTGFMEGFRNTFKGVGPITTLIEDSIESLREEYGRLIEAIGFDTADSDKWAAFGEILGTIAGVFVKPLAAGLGIALRVGGSLIRVFTGAVKLIQGVFEGLSTGVDALKALANGDWKTAWELFGSVFDSIWGGITSGLGTIIDGIIGMISDLLNFLADTIMAIPETFRPDFLTATADAIYATRAADFSTEGVGETVVDTVGQGVEAVAMPWKASMDFQEEMAAKQAAATGESTSGGYTLEQLETVLKKVFQGQQAQPQATVVQVDGETLVSIIDRVKRSANALGYGADQAEED
ncbi:MAG: phage tail tape measure protein [Hyphomicrobiaceae bacterium]|nr:MAG: phage tail tape measure protein [Hyphomicrobiaceae bacterium]